jgi:predicted nucleotidyltransferase
LAGNQRGLRLRPEVGPGRSAQFWQARFLAGGSEAHGPEKETPTTPPLAAMISDADRDILNLFALRVRERFPEARVWAFGSRARGDGLGDSDFDVCVILDRLDAASDHALSDVAWEVGFSRKWGQVLKCQYHYFASTWKMGVWESCCLG